MASRAGRAEQSLQEYLRSMLVESAARPPVADVLARAPHRVQTTDPGPVLVSHGSRAAAARSAEHDAAVTLVGCQELAGTISSDRGAQARARRLVCPQDPPD
ncbi:MAG: hypothetical protein M3022_03995 [Actinomycetota bacterium]|nr:hypothetical protein [Actinomycetota bacterium]